MKSKQDFAVLLSILVAFFLVISGLLLLFSPHYSGLLYDVTDLERMNTSITWAMGIRQLVLGVMFIALIYFKQFKAFGIVLLAGSLIPFTDFFLFCNETGWLSALRHLASIPILIGLGMYFFSNK
ncbi:MAG: DUF4267 domain-containing protein [Bacteroidota bacterium]